MTTIRDLLELSTAHLPETIADDLGSIAGVTAQSTAHGWLMWVPDNIPAEPAPRDVVRAIQRYARTLGCDYVLFDRDGDIIDALPTWDWR